MEGPSSGELAGLLAAAASAGPGTAGGGGGFGGGSEHGNLAGESVGVPGGTYPSPTEAGGAATLLQTDESHLAGLGAGLGRHADANFSAFESFLWPRRPARPEKLLTTVTLDTADVGDDADQTVEEFLETWKTEDPTTCCICLEDKSGIGNPFVFCDGPGCEVLVHLECYGIEKVPEPDEKWYCDACKADPADVVRCPFCPSTTGAFRRINHPFAKFVHITCAYWIPQVFINNYKCMTDIDITHVPPRLWNNSCYICADPEAAASGVCLECDAYRCKRAMHVTCAQKYGLLETEEDPNMCNPLFRYCCEHASRDGEPELNEWEKWVRRRDAWLTDGGSRRSRAVLIPAGMDDIPGAELMPDTAALLREAFLNARLREEDALHRMHQEILKLSAGEAASCAEAAKLQRLKIPKLRADCEESYREGEKLRSDARRVRSLVRALSKRRPLPGMGRWALEFSDARTAAVARAALADVSSEIGNPPPLVARMSRPMSAASKGRKPAQVVPKGRKALPRSKGKKPAKAAGVRSAGAGGRKVSAKAAPPAASPARRASGADGLPVGEDERRTS